MRFRVRGYLLVDDGREEHGERRKRNVREEKDESSDPISRIPRCSPDLIPPQPTSLLGPNHSTGILLVITDYE
jgi:hypothetical protein